MSGTRAVALAGFAVLALVTAPVAADIQSVTRDVLGNGMTVLVRENPAAPVVAVSLQVRGGSRFESAEQAGITNFLFRSMVRGTARRSAVQLAEAVEELGGRLEASSEVESAEIRGQALARNWEALLALVAEVAIDPSLLREEIERERRLLLSQLQTRADTPFSVSFDTMLRELYADHAYGWPSLGTRPSVERLDRAALLEHYRAILRPERMVLAVSGQVLAGRVIKTAERLFARLPRSPGEVKEPPVPKAPVGGRRVLQRAAQQAQILVGYAGPSLTSADYPAVRVLGALLGGGMAGRLFVELRDKRGLAYSLGVLAPYRAGSGFIVTYLGTARQNAAAAEAGVLQELERVRGTTVGQEELGRAKAYILGHLALDRRTNARQAWYLAFFEAVGAGEDFAERYATAIEAVTAADIRAVAQRYFVHPTIVVLLPPER